MSLRPLANRDAAEVLMTAFDTLIPERPGPDRDAWRAAMLTVVHRLEDAGVVVAVYDPES